jgi:mucin-19
MLRTPITPPLATRLRPLEKQSPLPGFLSPTTAKYYLRWTFTGVGGSTNGQGIGIDNFSVTATLPIPPDYTITTTGNAIVITDISGNGDVLDVSESGSNINFNVAGRTYSLNGGATTAFPVNVPLAGATSIEINAEAGNDVINIGAFTAALPSLTINGGTGNDAVNFNGDITFAANAHLDVDMQNDDATPGEDQVTVAANANLILSGTGVATVKVSRNVVVNSGGSIETGNGDLWVEANQQATATSGNFRGVSLSGGALQVNGSGALTVKGRGGNSGSLKIGIEVLNAGKIQGGTGTVTVEGIGGSANGQANLGVRVEGANSRITSSGGAVQVKGTGGGGSFSFNDGVDVRTGGEITAGGSGTVTVEGFGGASGGDFNLGVWVEGANSRITSSGGAVQVKGTGGGSGSSRGNYGVTVEFSGEITAGGSGTVTVEGLGGTSSGSANFGVHVSGNNARIASSGGAVQVKGTGGGSGSSVLNYGIYLLSLSEITAGGSGTVTVEGLGGTSSGSSNSGVLLSGADARISSSGGAVEVRATGNSGANPAVALRLDNSGAISSGNNANITVLADGINISAPASINSGTGTTTIRPRTTGTLINLGGADVLSGSPLTLGLTDAELDQITAGTLIIGDANSGNLTVSAAISRPAATNVQLRSGGDVTFNQNFNTNGGTLLLAPGNSPAAVKPVFNGTDATASVVSFASDLAIVINGTTPGDGAGATYTQLTVLGDVNLTGVDLVLSGIYSPVLPGHTFVIVNNLGANPITGTFTGLLQGATIPNFLGSGLDAIITYTGGDGNDVVLTVLGPPDYTITTTGNAIVITDDAGNGDVLNVSESGSNINFNVAGRTYSLNGGTTTAFPVDVPLAGATSIEINAEAGNDVINIGAFTTVLPSLTINGGTGDDAVNFNGDITFAANAHLDVDLQNDDAAPGEDRVTIATNANLILSGTGTATVKVSRNVTVNSGGSLETENGSLTVEANQQMTATSGNFIGVNVQNGAVVRASGSGAVTVLGRGASVSSGGGNYGVYVNGSQITSGGGAVLVEGTGGDSNPGGGGNIGVYVDFGGAITSTGTGSSATVTVKGGGGNIGGGGNYGIHVNGNGSRISSSGGAVLVEGTGSGTEGGAHYGVYVNFGGAITSTGTGSGATVTVKGFGGNTSLGGSYGVLVNGISSQITSNGGAVLVEGTGGGTDGGAHYGVYVDFGGAITNTGMESGATVTVRGFGGNTSSGGGNYGVYVSSNGSRITSSGGSVLVKGTGGGAATTAFNYGVYVGSNGAITSTGTGSDAAVTVEGTGGNTTGGSNYGVYVSGTNAQITSNGGPVRVEGTGGGSGDGGDNSGVYVNSGGVITSTGTGSDATVTVEGTGSNTTGNSNHGVYVSGTNAQITSSGGNVSVTGQGTGSAADIITQSTGAITSTSTTAGITLHSTNNGTWPNTAGTDVSTTATQKTTFGAGSKLNIDIDGLTANTQYQQLGVVGMIDLNGATLTFAGSTFTPALGNTFTIVNNDGTDPVIGTFNGLAQGATILNFLGSGLNATISYIGGTGNDVVLTVVAACPTITFTATPSNACANDGQIVITGVIGGMAPYMYSIDNGANYQSGDTFTGLAVNSYQVKIKDANGCESDATTVTVAAPTCPATGLLTWTGAVNTNWNNACNWDAGCVPTAANEVTIPDVANDPVIMAGTAAVAKSVQVQPNALLTIAATGSLTLEGSTSSPSGGMFNQGTVTNNGEVHIGPNINAGQYGLVNEGTFNNNADSELNIDRTSNIGLWNRTATAALINAGAIAIGGIGNVGSAGIYNEGDIQNNGGEIEIDRFGFGAGINNRSNSTISNSGKIIVGKIAASGAGIYNFGHIENLAAGEVEVDHTNSGIFTTTTGSISSSFTNAGKIAIGQTASISGPGIFNQSAAGASATFNNMANAEILLDRTNAGIHNETNCSFDNSGLIKIGTTATGIGFSPGVYNRSTFNNHAGGEIRMDAIPWTGLHHQSGTFTNGGKIIAGINVTNTNFTPGVYNEATFINQADAEIHIDRFTHVGFQNAFNASMTNAGLIKIGENVLGGNNGLYNDGTFDNQASGEIHVDNIPDANNRNGVYNASGDNFTNAGKIFIGSAVGAGSTGLFNNGTFGNSGEITVDNVRGTSNRHGLFHGSGTFTNTGKIDLGSTGSIGDWGIFSLSTFNNNAGGEISIDRCAITGVRNGSFGFGGTFTNAGKLTIGGIASVGNWGLWNDRPFNNSGEMAIDNAAVTGLRHQSNTFTNSGSIELGSTATVGEWGLWSQSYFLNQATGQISIDRSSSTGLLVILDSLHNMGTITIGELAPVGPQAIYSGQAVRNFPCAVINIYAPLNNVSNFFNSGLFYVNTAGTHTNTGFAFNFGIITYPQGNPIPDMINQEIIIAPLTVNDCDVISPAFDLGSPVDFTIEGIFTDEAATVSAGAYVTATNTFTPNPVLIEDTHQFYVKITDGSGGCTRIVAWELTTQNCCDAPEALCKPATAVLVGNSASIVVADVDNGSTADCGLQSITVSPSAFNCSHVGTPQTVTLTVTDVKGSSSTCIATVTVIDNTPPSITCPATQTLVLGADCKAFLPDYTGLAAVSDSCGVQSVTQLPAAGTLVSGAGNMVVRLFATDVNNNIDSCYFTVTKVDNTPPSITCPATQTLVLDANCSAILPNYTGLAAVSDSCGVQSVTQLPAAGTLVSGAGNMVVRLFATDVNNNIDSCSFTVIKVDNTPPTIQCFNQTVTFNGETAIPLNAGSLVDTTDNCGVATIVLSPTAISCEQVGQVVPVTITVTDINGNPATCTSNITVGGLPCGWSQQPDGVNCANGNSIAYNPANGVWTATSTNCFYGSAFTADQLAFAQRTLCGDGSITAQVTDISGTALGWAGVVMRESNAAGAKKAQLMTNLSTLSRREFRTTTNGQAFPQQFPSQNRYWLRLVRAGSQFSMYVSANGLAWYFVGAQNIPMNSCIQVGLVATNYQQNSTVTATFSNVGFTGSNVPPLVGASTPLSTLEPATNASTPLSTNNEQRSTDFQVYPNPTSGELNVNLAQYAGRAVCLEVYSLTGQLLRLVEIEEVQTGIEQLDLSALQSGMYLVKVKSDGLPEVTRRIVLTRG